ncbi:MAG: substrate-binding domain-containing protein [Clostridia bacterium]|jgi:ribose transport system substrate-binding protein|nr:substrate-binding domain-containing protein [Clostridia bacterium]
MYCEKCGNEISGDNVFCDNCGAASDAPVQPPRKATVKASSPYIPANSIVRKSRKSLWISLSAVALVLIASALIVIFVVLPFDSFAYETYQFSISTFEGEIYIFEESYNLEEEHITYEIDGEEIDELFSEDFMDEPVDVTLLIEDENEELLKTIFIPGIMIIDTSVNDSILWHDYKDVTTLLVKDPEGMVELSNIIALESIRGLFLDDCIEITNIDDLAQMNNLSILSLTDLDIDSLDALQEFESLVCLDLLELDEINDFDVLVKIKSLRTLLISRLPLEDLNDLGELSSLETLSLVYMDKIDDVDTLSSFSSLKSLRLKGLDTLEDIDVIGEMEALNKVTLINLDIVKSIDMFEDISGLQEVLLVRLPLLNETESNKVLDKLRDADVIVYAENAFSIKETSDLVIGFINAGSDPYYDQYGETFNAVAELMGIEVISMHSSFNIQKEISNAQSLIDMNVDAIAVVSTNTEGSADTIALANEAEMPIFFIGAGPKINEDNEIAGYVSEDYTYMGYMLGQWVAKNYPGAKCVNIPGYLEHWTAKAQIIGFDTALKEAGMEPAILLRSSQWQYQYALQIARDLIASGIEFDVVFACNEPTFYAVQQVFEELGVTDKIIVSTNGHEDGIPYIISGDLAASAPNPPSLTIDLCVQQIAKYFNNASYVEQIYIVPDSVVDASNIDNLIPWDTDAYMEGRSNGDFEFDLKHYEDAFIDNFDKLIELYDLLMEYLDLEILA